MLTTKAMRTGKLAIVVLIGQFVPLVEAQTWSLASKLPQGKVESVEVRTKRVEQGIEPLEFNKGEAPVALDLAQVMQLANDPGLAVAVIDGFKIAWAKGYGFTEPAGTKRVTTKTLFQAASISKPVTAMGMLALVEQGKLSLDEDVNAKLKTWKIPENEFTREQKVTLRRLASHTAGLTVHGFPGYDVDEKLPTLVQIFNGEKPANTPPIRVDIVPGTKQRYSGGGVTIEQQVMVDVTGKPFAILMKQLVLDRVSMKDSTYEQPLPSAWAARTATGAYTDGKPVHGGWHVYPEMAAAGLWTTPTDLAKFAIEVALSKHGRSNKVLNQRAVQEMVTPQPSTDDSGIGGVLTTRGLKSFIGVRKVCATGPHQTTPDCTNLAAASNASRRSCWSIRSCKSMASHSHAAVELLFGNPIDAVLLDCHQLGDQRGDLVAALRIVKPDVPIVMISAYCSLPCDYLRQANACVQKGDTARTLLRTLEAAVCASRFGLCRSVAA